MKIERYKDFDRIYPKFRFSISLYNKWIKNDWLAVWQYLTRSEVRSTKAQDTGKKGHLFLELNPLKELEKIVGKGEGSNEIKYEKDFEGYKIVGVLDREINDYVVDYKFGGRSGYENNMQLYMYLSEKLKSLLVQCAPIWDEKKENIVGARILHTTEYRRNEQKIEYLLMGFDTMYSSIMYQIHDGMLEAYLRQYMF